MIQIKHLRNHLNLIILHFVTLRFNMIQMMRSMLNRTSFSFAESPFVIKWVSSDYTLVPPWSSPQMHWQIPRHSLVQFSHRGTKMSLLITHHRLHITRSRRQIPALFARRNTRCLEFSFKDPTFYTHMGKWNLPWLSWCLNWLRADGKPTFFASSRPLQSGWLVQGGTWGVHGGYR